MSDIDEVSPATETVLDSVKNIAALAKDKQYGPAAKATVNLGKMLYNKHLKGKYITVKGKQIPMTLVAIVAVLGLYIITPSCGSEEKVEKPAVSSVAKKEVNTYDKDGLKIHDMRKCEQAACGLLENTSNKKVKKMLIPVNFHNESGEVVYEGGVEAKDIEPMTRMKLNIPSEVPFAYFSLGEITVD
jgi:hypothetical protein